MRIQYYDNLRATACFLVILTHSAMPALKDSYGPFMVFFSLIALPSSELFVSISSSLIAPNKIPMIDFYKKRFSKLLWPFLFWSMFMVGYRFFMGEINADIALKRILLFPIKPTEGVYWFVYAICALYLINPIISPWLENAKKREYHIVIGFWLLTLILPYLNIITGSNIYELNGNYYSIFAYTGGFAGFMILGVYFKKFPIFMKNKLFALTVVLALIFAGTLPVVYAYLYNRAALVILTDNLSLTSAFYVCAIFIFFKNIELASVVERGMSIIAKYSFGIYLIHILIVREVVWKILENSRLPHPLLETPFIALTSLFMCFLIVKSLSYIPHSKYIIGN